MTEISSKAASPTDGASADAPQEARLTAKTWWERLHPIRAGRLWRCRALGTHHPVIVDMGQRKVCLTCNEWTEIGR